MADLTAISHAIEVLLVERNLRGMEPVHRALAPGYGLRAAQTLHQSQRVLIGTGFPVAGTFETDGPVGALALYRALEALGIEVHLACARPLAGALQADYRTLELDAFDQESGRTAAQRDLARLRPDVVVSIERPGLGEDGHYYNMRGEDISAHCAVFDFHLLDATCPTIAIGDGGNEIGMGKVAAQIEALEIRAAVTPCDELIVADVSNWGAYGLIALLELLSGDDLLRGIDHRAILTYLSDRGSVDGVTRKNTLTEDGLGLEAGEALLARLAELVATHNTCMRETHL